ncbi:hypothetical protein P3G55_23165 [Leptospira sp. 96542]|nr:hypothetical protein [Leptospira sp. 96542]
MIDTINTWLLAIALWLGLTDDAQRAAAVRAVLIGLGVSLLLTQFVKSHPLIAGKKGQGRQLYDWNIRAVAFVIAAPLTMILWPGPWATDWPIKVGFGLCIGAGASPFHQYLLMPALRLLPWWRPKRGQGG